MDHEALGLCTCTSRNVTSLLQADCLYRLYVNEARFRAKLHVYKKMGWTRNNNMLDGENQYHLNPV